MNGSRCRRCGSTDVHWAQTEGGRPMMIDDEPHPNGNVVVAHVHRDGTKIVHVLNKVEMAEDRRQRLFAHAAYCGKQRPAPHPLPPQRPFQDVLVMEA